MSRFAVSHRANNRHFVGDLSGVLKVLTEFDSLDRSVNGAKRPSVFGRSIGLWVP